MFDFFKKTRAFQEYGVKTSFENLSQLSNCKRQDVNYWHHRIVFSVMTKGKISQLGYTNLQ